MEIKIPHEVLAFVLQSVARTKLGEEYLFTKVVSFEDAELTIKSFFAWAEENGLLKDGIIDVSKFLK